MTGNCKEQNDSVFPTHRSHHLINITTGNNLTGRVSSRIRAQCRKSLPNRLTTPSCATANGEEGAEEEGAERQRWSIVTEGC